MARLETIHLFGGDGKTGVWGRTPVRAAYSHREPSTDELANALAEPRPVALALADRIAPETLTSAEVDDGVTVFIESPTAAFGGRGTPELVIEVLRTAPAVGVLLTPSILEAGSVALGVDVPAFRPADPGGVIDPLGEAIAAYSAHGGSLRVIRGGQERGSIPATDPPALRPREKSIPHLSRRIERFEPGRSLGEIASTADAAAVKAGVWLWFDFLHESHHISQSIEGAGRTGAGDYWHAIMHRREGDYGNSKYWFRRVGRSPVFAPLAERVPRIAADFGADGDGLLRHLIPKGNWDPMAFVDACARSERSGDPQLDLLLRRIQADEMLLLLLQTLRDACD